MSMLKALHDDDTFGNACAQSVLWERAAQPPPAVSYVGCPESGYTFLVVNGGVVGYNQLMDLWDRDGWAEHEYAQQARVLIFSEDGFETGTIQEADATGIPIYDLGPDGSPRALTDEARSVEWQLRRRRAAGAF